MRSPTAREVLSGRVVWHVNSTARGGGVAELLQSLLAYARGAGVDVRWVTISGNPEFFQLTKRIHNHLHGSAGDGGPPGARGAQDLRGRAGRGRRRARRARSARRRRLHPRSADGRARPARRRPRTSASIWRCHVGVDRPGELARAAWDFLRPTSQRRTHTSSRARRSSGRASRPRRVWIVPPSIDAFSPKNQDLEPEAVAADPGRCRLAAGGSRQSRLFHRYDGSQRARRSRRRA